MYFIETEDRLMSKILKGNQVKRENFNPKNKAHLESFKKFLSTGNWGKIQFYVEAPYVTVPETVLRKFCMHQLKMLPKQTNEHPTT
jgi:hypothetical protein